MKRIIMFSFSIVIMLGCLSCNAQDNKKQSTQSAVLQKVEVYYFHFTRRCNTCKSVENNAKLAVESLYADKIRAGENSFKAINLDDASSKSIAEELGVGGQTLLVVCGKSKVDITSQGFMCAHNLEKMKDEIQKAVSKAVMN